MTLLFVLQSMEGSITSACEDLRRLQARWESITQTGFAQLSDFSNKALLLSSIESERIRNATMARCGKDTDEEATAKAKKAKTR
jgi:hypothetical protein